MFQKFGIATVICRVCNGAVKFEIGLFGRIAFFKLIGHFLQGFVNLGLLCGRTARTGKAGGLDLDRHAQFKNFQHI